MFEVEKVEVPRVRRAGAAVKIPFDKLVESGDSFFVPDDLFTINSVKTYAQDYRRESGTKVSVMKEPGGCRVIRR